MLDIIAVPIAYLYVGCSLLWWLWSLANIDAGERAGRTAIIEEHGIVYPVAMIVLLWPVCVVLMAHAASKHRGMWS